jgi:hypothetical protein
MAAISGVFSNLAAGDTTVESRPYWRACHPLDQSYVFASAAAPEASLSFLFWGAGLFVLPIIAIYSIAVFWMFRGKMREGYR